ncbi:MAG: N-acetylneuraminate synthase family protein, partial [Candidatus Eremiobacteraeota bacterium]|nr:N-acetylneuraminate synthase family protein [Candidatus Eremiobacteraeota bacterium]
MSKVFKLGERLVGDGQACYVIAELSCNHEGDFDEAVRLVEEAAKAGADAIKTQTYTADTLTRNFGQRPAGTMWADIDLYSLYQKAATPQDWHQRLQRVAIAQGLDFFSSPFDETAVEHLASLNVPAYKIASFELVDYKLLQRVARQGRPVIISNGMTNYLELDEALRVLRSNGARDVAVLHCNSGYPAAFEEANLETIPALSEILEVVVGLSDHTLFADDVNFEVPLAHVTPFEAVRLGAKIVEVHLLLDRNRARERHRQGVGGFDWAFSREPAELKRTVDLIRRFERGEQVEYATAVERAKAAATHGQVRFEPTEKELASRRVRPSLWVVEDISEGEVFQFAGARRGNIDSIRPAGGLEIRFADFVDG